MHYINIIASSILLYGMDTPARSQEAMFAFCVSCLVVFHSLCSLLDTQSILSNSSEWENKEEDRIRSGMALRAKDIALVVVLEARQPVPSILL
jgi:hypothetical protein